MNDPPIAPKGLIVIATLLVVISLKHIDSEVTADGFVDSWATALSSHPLLAALKLAAIGAGIVTAIGLWNAATWARWSYLAWFGLFVCLIAYQDSSVEQVIWKLVAGVVIQSILPRVAGAYLFDAYKRVAAATTSMDDECD